MDPIESHPSYYPYSSKLPVTDVRDTVSRDEGTGADAADDVEEADGTPLVGKYHEYSVGSSVALLYVAEHGDIVAQS